MSFVLGPTTLQFRWDSSIMNGIHAIPPRASSELALLLKSLRQRIDRDVHELGPYARHRSRLGKRVTQEELAEAIGVSRAWYALLESGAATTRASTRLLDRLADALMVTPAERTTLFRLAVPEFGRVHLRNDSVAALESFSCLRSITKRLWTATSNEDVLTTASEQLAEWFSDALLVRVSWRCDSGVWQARCVDDEQERNNAARIARDLRERKDLLPTPELHAVLNFHPELARAGDVATPELWPGPVRRELSKAYARHRVAGFTGRYVRVRSRSGFTGGLLIAHELGHSYADSDIVVLGAFAELASLALS